MTSQPQVSYTKQSHNWEEASLVATTILLDHNCRLHTKPLHAEEGKERKSALPYVRAERLPSPDLCIKDSLENQRLGGAVA